MKRIPLYTFLTSLAAILIYENNINYIIPVIFIIPVLILVKQKYIKLLLIFLIVCFLFTIFRMDKANIIKNELVESDSSDHKYVGKIISYPSYDEETVKFTLQLLGYNERVQCRIFNCNKELYYGQVISFKGIIDYPKGKRNPGGFDYRKYLKSKNIHYIASINDESLSIEDEYFSSTDNIILSIRKGIVQVIDNSFETGEREFLKGIFLGEKSLDQDIVNDFNILGISHILAVSGLHIGFIYLFIHVCLTKMHIPKYPQLLIISIVLYCYCFIVGFSISVIRASVMLIVYLLSDIINKKYDTLNALGIIGTIFLWVNPYTLFTSAYQLSFSCVLSITIFYPYLNHKLTIKNKLISYVKSTLLLTLCIQLGTIPFLAFHFQSISFITILVNFIVVPLTGLIIILLILFLCLSFILGIQIHLIITIIHMLVKVILDSTGYFTWFPFANTEASPFSINNLIFYYLIIFLLMGYAYIGKPRNLRIVQLILLFSIMTTAILCIIPQPLKITVLDVGQGDSILIETPLKKTILIDGGGQQNYPVGDEIIKKALLFKHIHKLDLIICTHSDDDHMLGIMELMDDIKIGGIMINCLEKQGYDPLIDLCYQYEVPVFINNSVRIDLLDQLELKILYPYKDTRYIDENNSSVVVKLKYKDRSFLFTGDLEKQGEAILMGSKPDELKSDVLKIAHHGSNTSSTETFLDEVSPHYAIISVGENNYFGHPHPDVISRLMDRRISVYRTDTSGAIEITSDGKYIHFKEYDSGT